ncbi:hypothetical protein GNP63_14250 [Aliivibrio fischeri]|uniref:hypothetical protein n=1 Tax=Aliivibrio fischeri TaxID=668 RepID=UPI0012D898B6|nr:hypothetical protein [Aliivibrio fischeri]MUH97695.1 hypothetical protein [Aliivibrio fischeri]
MKKLTFSSLLLLSNISYAETLVADYFDPNQHQIFNVTLGEITNKYEEYTIYNNGRMQAPIDIDLDIFTHDGKRVTLKNLTYNDGRPLIDIYLRKNGNVNGLLVEGVENHGWTLSKKRNQYDNVISGNEHYDDPDEESIDSNNYSFFYVTSKNTAAYEELCVNVYDYDSCGDGNDSHANVKVIPSINYVASDFKVDIHNTNWAGYPGNNRLGDSFFYDISLKNRGNHYIESSNVIDPIPFPNESGSGMSILSQQSSSKNVLLTQDWNWNHTLIHLEQKDGEIKYWEIPYWGWWSGKIQYINERIYKDKGTVRLYHIAGTVRVIATNINEGVWGGASEFFRFGEKYRHLSIIDNFGNQSNFIFKLDTNTARFYII